MYSGGEEWVVYKFFFCFLARLLPVSFFATYVACASLCLWWRGGVFEACVCVFSAHSATYVCCVYLLWFGSSQIVVQLVAVSGETRKCRLLTPGRKKRKKNWKKKNALVVWITFRHTCKRLPLKRRCAGFKTKWRAGVAPAGFKTLFFSTKYVFWAVSSTLAPLRRKWSPSNSK